VIILDVPFPSYIPSLLDSFTRSPFYCKMQSESPEHTIHSIFHICGEGVLEDERYVEFMNKFPTDTNVSIVLLKVSCISHFSQHIISSPECDRDVATFKASVLDQMRMNQLDPVMFPIQKFSLEPKKRLEGTHLSFYYPLLLSETIFRNPGSSCSLFSNGARSAD
jgi:ribonuclease Z